MCCLAQRYFRVILGVIPLYCARYPALFARAGCSPIRNREAAVPQMGIGMAYSRVKLRVAP